MFYISKTYSEITPDSAENGETSDSGFVFESARYTYSELLSEINNDSYIRECICDWISTGYYISDYGTCTEIEYSLHIDREKSSARAIRLWDSIK